MLLKQLVTCVGVASASAISLPISEYARAFKAKRDDVSTSQMTDMEYYCQHAGAAYCNWNTPAGQAVECDDDVCPDVQATVLQSFYGNSTGIGAYVAVDHNRQEIVLSVRGSSNTLNWITNFSFAWRDCDFVDQCKFHAGFDEAWEEISDGVTGVFADATQQWPSYKIITTGHSLGAAVTTIAGTFLRQDGYAVDIYNYGSPRVANDHYAYFINNQTGSTYRVTHIDDPVPRLPPISFGYRHTSPEYWLSTGNSSNTVFTTSDVEICEGIENTDCNGGTSGLDVDAHRHYFEFITGCGKSNDTSSDTSENRANKLFEDGEFSRSADRPLAGMTPAEITAQLNEWSKEDRELSAKQE